MVVPVPTDATIVFLLILAAVLLFATEHFTPDVTAITIIVALVILEPWTGVGTETAVSGFANVATITVAAMYMLSEGIHRTGLVRVLRDAITDVAGDSTDRLQWTTLSLTGGLAGAALAVGYAGVVVLASGVFVFQAGHWEIATGASVTGVVGMPLVFGGLGGFVGATTIP